MNSVSKAAQEMVEEARRQFRETGHLERNGTSGLQHVHSHFDTCRPKRNDIPGLLAVVCPIGVGVLPALKRSAAFWRELL